MQTTFVPFKQPTRRSHSPASDPGTPDWRLQKPFGAGLKRKRLVKFVPATDTSLSSTTPAPTTPRSSKSGTEISDLYLSLVGLSTPPLAPPPETCPDCALPITDAATHATSTAHLAALPHAHPPHPYDRSSKGLKVLMESGWDPDARVGLGKEGRGMRYPLKTVPKDDKFGVGVKKRKGGAAAGAGVVKKEGVKEVRRREEMGKRVRGRLMGELGGGVDVQEVLNRRME
ncbi:putative G-patch domain protein [Morchella snyderi]|nr:putative G-patch domain protein [Morchella snyderi]